MFRQSLVNLLITLLPSRCSPHASRPRCLRHTPRLKRWSPQFKGRNTIHLVYRNLRCRTTIHSAVSNIVRMHHRSAIFIAAASISGISRKPEFRLPRAKTGPPAPAPCPLSNQRTTDRSCSPTGTTASDHNWRDSRHGAPPPWSRSAELARTGEMSSSQPGKPTIEGIAPPRE